MKRRNFLLMALGLPFFVGAASATFHTVVVFKSITCGCCNAWITRLEKAGFSTKGRNISQQDLTELKQKAGINPEFAACHTAFIEHYFVEGHVPADDIKKLISTKPDALGLAVPGMPVGSPGMEIGNEKEPFDTLLVKNDGSAEVFSSHRTIRI
ncbi:MAG: metal-binding protein [Rhodospirillaceae bacterium TMED8]|nr:metal-binding protein [Magnetovibrio sp.]OUT48536.1 MAG: metal-binding protein [Rhodospirillaceae bacterium TMED8]|tara:strand:- start:478 stop:939 length:462 start_codon:yes stop_codon:yes gene_type:complete